MTVFRADTRGVCLEVSLKYYLLKMQETKEWYHAAGQSNGRTASWAEVDIQDLIIGAIWDEVVEVGVDALPLVSPLRETLTESSIKSVFPCKYLKLDLKIIQKVWSGPYIQVQPQVM